MNNLSFDDVLSLCDSDGLIWHKDNRQFVIRKMPLASSFDVYVGPVCIGSIKKVENRKWMSIAFGNGYYKKHSNNAEEVFGQLVDTARSISRSCNKLDSLWMNDLKEFFA